MSIILSDFKPNGLNTKVYRRSKKHRNSIGVQS